MPMNDEQRSRYSRHILLSQIGEAGQERLLASRVLVVGLGGLGSPVAMYLGASGVGQLVLSDYDHVELSNLQRQIIHTTDDLDRNKVDSARDAIRRLNPNVEVTAKAWELDDDELTAEIAQADVVADACDNFETRYTLNRLCWEAGTPLVSGAAMRMEGLVSAFDPNVTASPCYRCLFPDDSAEGDACSRVGVLAPLLGIVGSVQAVETMKLLLGIGETLVGRVMIIDALDMDWRTLKLRKDPACPVCNAARGASTVDPSSAQATR